MSVSKANTRVAWRISVPIFKNPLIVRQLWIAIGIPFGLLAVTLVFVARGSVYLFYGLGLIGALLFFTWLFVMAVYRGQYEAEFVLDGKGVLCRTQSGQARVNRFINALTVVSGLFSGKPGVAGAGLLAQSRQEAFLAWRRVRKVTYKPSSCTILLYGGWAENLALFCTQHNYAIVEQMVADKTKT